MTILQNIYTTHTHRIKRCIEGGFADMDEAESDDETAPDLSLNH